MPSINVDGVVRKAVPVTAEMLAGYDALIVCTDHTAFPWELIARHGRLIVDARGAVPREHARGTLVPLSGPALCGPAPAGPGAAPARVPAAARGARA